MRKEVLSLKRRIAKHYLYKSVEVIVPSVGGNEVNWFRYPTALTIEKAEFLSKNLIEMILCGGGTSVRFRFSALYFEFLVDETSGGFWSLDVILDDENKINWDKISAELRRIFGKEIGKLQAEYMKLWIELLLLMLKELNELFHQRCSRIVLINQDDIKIDQSA